MRRTVAAASVLTLASLTVANAAWADDSSRTISPLGETCTATSTLSITLDDEPGKVYSLDDNGNLVDGPLVQASDCASPVVDGGGLVTAAAAAPVVLGSKTFTGASPTFSKTDTQGSFTAQYSYSSKTDAVAFGYQVSTALRALATGVATETVKRNADTGSCGDHHVVAVSYHFHWTCGSPRLNYQYYLIGDINFPIKAPAGMVGKAEILWRFNYKIGSGTGGGM